MLLTLAMSIALLAIAEAVIRFAIFSNRIQVPWLENPSLYANPETQDDYWVLYHYYSAARYPTKPIVPHPVVGWIQENGGDLGTRSPRYRSINDVTGHPILFFGDSFVAGPDNAALALPQLLEEQIPNASILNYGVGGYGVDQIALRVKQEGARFKDRHAQLLIGIMLRDLDRSLLRFRHSQKPYYTIEQDELRLHQPADPDNLKFIDNYPFQIRSFVFAAIQRRLRFTTQRLRDAVGHQSDTVKRRRQLNRAILKDLVEHLQTEMLPAVFVIFYSETDLTHHAEGNPSQRERDLKTILSDLGTRYIDTAPSLLQAVEAKGMRIHELYDRTHHFTATANEIIAKTLSSSLAETSKSVHSHETMQQ